MLQKLFKFSIIVANTLNPCKKNIAAFTFLLCFTVPCINKINLSDLEQGK